MIGELDNKHYNLVKKYVKSWNLAIDGGANKGNWSNLMAKDFSTVVAFEPIENLYTALPNNVVLNQKALGAHIGKAKLFYDGKRTSSRSAFISIGSGPIDVVTIDSLQLQLQVDLIKLDLEGFEYFALLGAKETIAKYKPTIVVEIDDFILSKTKGVPGEAVKELLDLFGYVCIDSIDKDYIFIPK